MTGPVVVATVLAAWVGAAVVALMVGRKAAASQRAGAERAEVASRRNLEAMRSEWAALDVARHDATATGPVPSPAFVASRERFTAEPTGWGAPEGEQTIGALMATEGLVDITRLEDPGVRVVTRERALEELRTEGAVILAGDTPTAEVQRRVHQWRREQLDDRLARAGVPTIEEPDHEQ